MGTVESLFPDGVRDIRELPAPHFDTIHMTLIFLDFEELPVDERPPKKIWLDDDALRQHFDWIKRKRKAEMENPGGGDSGGGPMKRNAAARDMIVQ